MNKLISEIKETKGLKIVCPNCEAEIGVKMLKMVDMYEKLDKNLEKALIDQKVGLIEILKNTKMERANFRRLRKEKPNKHEATTVSVNIGKIVEKIVPSFDDFPFARKDCRALFEPIDYLIFDGLSKGSIKKIRFLDVKTGNANLNKNQKLIREALTKGNIKHIVDKELNHE